jgi:hypothetical protein
VNNFDMIEQNSRHVEATIRQFDQVLAHGALLPSAALSSVQK